ncbi:MAG TPA: peptidase M28 [Phycisphaerales bacterium]|nr:peptidase M28 [Phycisphaerales bacterium]
MWELIRANKRNSIILMTLMAMVLLGIGLLIGAALFGPRGALIGVAIAAAVWLVMMLVSLSSGDEIFLAASGARPVTHDDYPQLFNIVEEMTIAAGLPAVPKVYVIPDPAPNAFATGRDPSRASVAVTAGLLGRLNRDELQGVIAHEISHILHRDIMYVTLAGVMLGTIVLLSEIFFRGMLYGGGSRRRYSGGGKSSGGAEALLIVVAVVAAILAPIMAQLLYFALSRRREYLADAGAARLTRYPEGLASALEKIAADASPQMAKANKVSAPMYIVNPLKPRGQAALSNLSSTHPPIAERVKILRGMMHGASFKDYSDAYTAVTKKPTVVPAMALSKEDIALREAGAKAKQQQRRQEQVRQVGDIMRQVGGFAFLTCACGLKMKVPPDYKSPQVRCPRCKRTHDIPKK